MSFLIECMTNDGKFDAENGLPPNIALCDRHPAGAEAYRKAYAAALIQM